ncbi:MAG: hypothetical protein ABSH32_20855 [Bryobacteraceae bacterium]|jgi:hypothetical protein
MDLNRPPKTWNELGNPDPVTIVLAVAPDGSAGPEWRDFQYFATKL